MANLATAQIIGRLLGDPESRVLPNSGVTVTQVRIASGRSKKNPQTGVWEEDPNTLYIDAKAFDYPDSKRRLGEVLTKYAKKGDQIALTGTLVTESWEDKNGGGKRSKTVLNLTEVQLLGGKSEPREPIDAEDPGRTMAPKQQQRQQPQKPAQRPVPDDDIPFSWALPFVGAAMGVASLFA